MQELFFSPVSDRSKQSLQPDDFLPSKAHTVPSPILITQTCITLMNIFIKKIPSLRGEAGAWRSKSSSGDPAEAPGAAEVMLIPRQNQHRRINPWRSAAHAGTC